MIGVAVAAAVAAAAAGAPPPDAVLSLPTYGAPRHPQYAGFADATPDGRNKLHYWFSQSEAGVSAPLLLWLNGGPGASSLTGQFAEKLGPQSITPNATLVDNPDTITNAYHLLTVDNPVGSGYSTTADGRYVRTEYEVRTQFVHALRIFFARHPEYAASPLWVCGESYAGHYVPNIAWEIAVNATEMRLQGVVIGNGMYNMKLQTPTIGLVAYAQGVIDDLVYAEVRRRQDSCLAEIDARPATAGDFCENVTVRWLYSDAGVGELFYYDVGLPDAKFFNDLTDAMGRYLNRADVVRAVHADGATWRQADEVGPVGDALLRDWTVDSDVVVAQLLHLGLKVRMYNGVRDLSSCNHLGNLAVAKGMKWEGAAEFASAPSVPWPSAQDVSGHVRTSRNFKYATVLRTGHLVPTVVPREYKVLLKMFLD